MQKRGFHEVTFWDIPDWGGSGFLLEAVAALWLLAMRETPEVTDVPEATVESAAAAAMRQSDRTAGGGSGAQKSPQNSWRRRRRSKQLEEAAALENPLKPYSLC